MEDNRGIDPNRHVPLAGGSNFRDVGGYVAADGRRIRWNTVYRSGALSRLHATDWQWFVERDIGTVCDLRSDQERELAPTLWQGGARTEHLGVAYAAELIFTPRSPAMSTNNVNEMHHSLYALFPRLLAPSFRAMFDALIAGQVPLIVHCSAGQDRTGLAIGLLLVALGVPQDTIVEDYMLSTDFRRVENELDHQSLAQLADRNIVASFYAQRIAQQGVEVMRARPLVNSVGEPLLLDAFAAIVNDWGSIEGYLEQELGMDPERIALLRENCLEPA
jgi:protein-tyrosine phosphatase